MDQENIQELVQRYLDKKTTAEELEVFVCLMKQDKLDKYFEEMMSSEISLGQDINQ